MYTEDFNQEFFQQISSKSTNPNENYEDQESAPKEELIEKESKN